MLLIFCFVSGIEVAYQEAVALKRQEELIREEEEAGLLEHQMKGKRGGGANEKDKRAKKKQVLVPYMHWFSSQFLMLNHVMLKFINGTFRNGSVAVGFWNSSQSRIFAS